MDKYSYQLYSQILKIFWRTIVVVLGVIAIGAVFPFVRNILVMFVIAWLLATILSPLVNKLEGNGVNRGVAILIVLLLLIGLIVLVISLVIPALIQAVESLTAKLQSDTLLNINEQVEAFFAERLNNVGLAQDVTNKVKQIGMRILSSLGGFLKNVGSFVASIAIIPFITFFLIKDMRLFKRFLISKVPNKYFELTLNVLHKIGNQVSGYILGQTMDALIVGILSVIGLFIINMVFENPVPQFILVGMIAGLANLIPYIGPVVGAVPALIIAIFNNPANLPMVLLWIVITFAIVQMIDNSLVSPMVVSKSVNMHPLVVVIVVIIGGNIAGPIGMLFAVPATGVIKVALSEITWGLSAYRLE